MAFGLTGSKPDLYTDCAASITGDIPSTAAAAVGSVDGKGDGMSQANKDVACWLDPNQDT